MKNVTCSVEKEIQTEALEIERLSQELNQLNGKGRLTKQEQALKNINMQLIAIGKLIIGRLEDSKLRD